METEKRDGFLDRSPPFFRNPVTTEQILFLLSIILAIVSRFILLGDRALSHDESVHLYYSYLFSEGQGYHHTPLSHGPFQFHAIALIFSLFGSSDFLGRVPHALASVGSVILIWKWRRYLGRIGSILTAIMMTISPYMLYYGRYARNESFVILLIIISLYVVLRYCETRDKRFLVILTISTALHFSVKETAFISSAQMLIYLLAVLLIQIFHLPWTHYCLKRISLLTLILAILSFILAGLSIIFNIFPSDDNFPFSMGNKSLVLFGSGLLFIAFLLLLVGYGWKRLKENPAFDILILIGTFTLPQLTAFPAYWLGLNPLDYHFTWPGWNISAIFSQTPSKIVLIFILLVALSTGVGLSWKKRDWLILAILFWGIYTFFFTSFFTNLPGFFTGSIGSLGYWLEQQSVHRGSQPWFYYLLIQIPMYEFLPFLGIFVAVYFRFKNISIISMQPKKNHNPQVRDFNSRKFFYLLLWWIVSSFIAYSLAGERMPWLTIHITLPMIILSGWGLGLLIEEIKSKIMSRNQWIILVTLCVGILTPILLIISNLLKPRSIILENSGRNLFISNQLLLGLIFLTVAISGSIYIVKSFNLTSFKKTFVSSCFAFFLILTIMISYRAAFLNSENAKEFIDYAHAAEGIKDTLEEINLINQRVGDGKLEILIAYDAGGQTQGVSWPWKWYLRNFTNVFSFDSIETSILDSDIVIADPQSIDQLDSLLKNEYMEVIAERIVWSNQDYFFLTLPGFVESLINSDKRYSLLQIWINTDYSLYTEISRNNDQSSAGWYLRDNFKLYVRKSLMNQIWEYSSVKQ